MRDSDAASERLEELSHLAAEVFRMLSDATRIQILSHLRSGELSVSSLVGLLERPQALVSQHLAKLRMARLVETRRHGAHVYYRLANEHVLQLVSDGLFHAEHIGPGPPDHHRQETSTPTTKGKEQ